jgi:hypothetical protein
VTNFTDESVTVTAPGDADWIVGAKRVGAYDLAVVEADVSTLSVRED